MVCLSASTTTLTTHREGAFVILEAVITKDTCNPSAPVEVRRLATLAAPAPDQRCPVGELALQYQAHGGFEASAFASTLEPESVLRAKRALERFAPEAAQAVVAACPTPSGADYVFVAHDGRVARFERGELRGAEEPAPLPPPSPQPLTETGDCTEPMGQGTQRWLGRALSTGVMPGPARLRVWAIDRRGAQALLVMKHHQSPTPGDGSWSCVGSSSLSATVVERGRQVEFQLSDGRAVRCLRRTVALAGANALRVPAPGPPTNEGCNQHRWATPPQVRRPVLECTSDDVIDFDHPVFLAEWPGVEHLTLDEDDCGDPLEALRLVPKDGAVAPTRPK